LSARARNQSAIIVLGRGGWSHIFRLLLTFCSKIFDPGSEVIFKFENPTPAQTPKIISATKNHLLPKPRFFCLD